MVRPVIVGRLAPSPTGAQHLGNARTYLATYWSAIRQGGRLILRIEDIDSPRVKPWAIQQSMDDLTWLGIRWNEGPGRCDEEASQEAMETSLETNASYIQTNRSVLYADAIDRLRRDDRIYPCTCTRRDIAQAASAPHDGDKVIVYPGTCATWQNGDPMPDPGTYCWRFRVGNERVTFEDGFAGIQSAIPSEQLGDFPITRKTGDAAYQLAVVVDDAAMNVTEVVRGDDLIDSTFWQLELFHALGTRPPDFIHVPLVVGKDGRRLAKRHGDTRLSHLREQGVQASEVITWVAESFGMSSCTGDLHEVHQRMAAQTVWGNLNPRRVVPPLEWLNV